MANLLAFSLLLPLVLSCEADCLSTCSDLACVIDCGCSEPLDEPWSSDIMGTMGNDNPQPMSALIVDVFLPLDGCFQKCSEACESSSCQSLCQKEFCPPNGDQVFYFFVGAVLCMALVSIAYDLMYRHSLKVAIQQKRVRPDLTRSVAPQ